MISKIRAYITRAFEDVPRTKKSIELQEELISNLIEKFNDQLKLGKNEDEAYTSVIAGIGDLSELVEGVRERQTLMSQSPEDRKKNALIIASAVVLYILSPMVLILFTEIMHLEILGLLMMFVLIAFATGMLVYNAASKPKYLREEETLVEEFKEWKAGKDKNQAAYAAFKSAFWLIIVAIYLFISFQYGGWAYTWIIFIVASAIQEVVRAIIELRRNHE